MPEWLDLSRYGVLMALVVIIGVSGWLGVVAQRAVSKGSFLKGFFLGNRGLGVWAMALTATVQSGGTFMGVPSLIYSFGFIVALWIGSYMIVPLTGFSFVGKRIAHLSRRTGAVTVPDLFRGRFDSPTVGLICSLMILFFLTFMLIAQFKAGAIVMSLAWPGAAESTMTLAEDAGIALDRQYYIGLTIFAVVVVGYTLFGGFLASVWTDLFQSVLMAIGVMILLVLSLQAAGGLEKASKDAAAKLDQVAIKAKADFARYEERIQSGGEPLTDAEKKKRAHAEIAAKFSGVGFVTGPGMGRDFLPLGLACSFFVVWIWGGVSSPASVLRVMATKSTATLRRSIVVLSIYNLFIYLPLIVVCICARSLMPDLSEPDTVIPRMALNMTSGIRGGTFISGLILAAPFGAVMATVSCYLVVLSSGLVRDVYQRFVNPHANEHDIRRMTYIAMIGVGLVALGANLNPPKYLQALVVFCTSGQTGALFAPIVMACYWRRATKEGVLAAMGSGAFVVLVLYGLGFSGYAQEIGPTTAFRPYFLFGLEPIVWAIAVSGIVGIAVSLLTPKPNEELVSRMFDVEKPAER
ncbi:MAG: sodium:solute symporter [Pirellula sp.]|nr:sodium:solute symporter [Pirellula sp.]